MPYAPGAFMRHIPVTDRNEDGSADLCSQCERPDQGGLALTEVAHAGGALRLCGVCFDGLPKCENCGERGGSATQWLDEDREAGYSVMEYGCSFCEIPKRSVALAPFTDEECPL